MADGRLPVAWSLGFSKRSTFSGGKRAVGGGRRAQVRSSTGIMLSVPRESETQASGPPSGLETGLQASGFSWALASRWEALAKAPKARSLSQVRPPPKVF